MTSAVEAEEAAAWMLASGTMVLEEGCCRILGTAWNEGPDVGATVAEIERQMKTSSDT